ncbi:hypothetical protein MDS_3498 [Ectopseudomonas mendocina NK-01]|nr:hypothetical protein MDS_3498 [Pseudomonas mendocina NK-01]
MVFTRLEARRVILKGLPTDYQVEPFWRFDTLRQHMTTVPLGAAEQWGDVGECLPERFDAFLMHG